MAAQSRVVRLEKSRMLSSRVRSLTFRDASGEAVRYQPGQWIRLRLPVGEGWVEQPYSIAGAPDPKASDTFEVAVSSAQEGMASVLHELPEGATIQAGVPDGRFVWQDARRGPALFVASGTGLAPFRAMLQTVVAPEGPALVLLFGCRTEAEILWADEFRDLERRLPRFRFEVSLSQPSPRWSGRRGYVQLHLPELVRSLEPVEILVAGSTEMVASVKDHVKRLGVRDAAIRTEQQP